MERAGKKRILKLKEEKKRRTSQQWINEHEEFEGTDNDG